MTGFEAFEAFEARDVLAAPDPQPDPYAALAEMRSWTFLPSKETR